MNQANKTSTGFTLTEVLIVIFIMTVLGIYSFSNFIASREKRNLEKTAIEIVNLIDQAKNESIQSFKSSYRLIQTPPPPHIDEFIFNCKTTLLNPEPGHHDHCGLIASADFDYEIIHYELPGDFDLEVSHPTHRNIAFQRLTGKTMTADYRNLITENVVYTISSPNYQINITVPPSGAVNISTIQPK